MSKSSELDRQVKLYILEVLSDHAETNNANDCIEYMKDRFNNEMNWLIDRDGSQKAMTEWLQGLAINIEYMNYNILQLAVKWGSLDENYTDKQAQKILDNYWVFMTTKCLQLMRNYSLPKSCKIMTIKKIYAYKNTTSSKGSGSEFEINVNDIDVIKCWFNLYGNPSYVFHMSNDDTYYIVDSYDAMNSINHISRICVERKKDMFKKWGGK